jgi:Cu(I)/Ag(I) efflux system membrane protein CusA/SilA
MRGPDDLFAAIHEGAVQRIRPKTMTVATDMIGLLPLLWATGTGADVTRRLVAPLIGGISVSFAMELLVYPAVFYLAKRRQMRREWAGR